MEHPSISKNIIQELNHAIFSLGLKKASIIKYGWHQKSASCKVLTKKNQEAWVRVNSISLNQTPNKLWTGIKDSHEIPINNKPVLLNQFEWKTKDRLWKAELMSYVKDGATSKTPELTANIELSESWIKNLQIALETIGNHSTNRVCIRQELINRRLAERYGKKTNTQIDKWVTAHGDIHWANITQPNLWILDWEAWGNAPKGFDIANLFCFSLMIPKVKSTLYENFNSILNSRDGVTSQLFICAEQMRMTEIYGDHPELYKYLKRHSQELNKLE